jgi:hypothetical protein
MGREKRIADRRAKDILEKSGEAIAPRREAPVTSAAAAAPVPAMAPAGHTGTGRAIVQIVLLYLLPTALMVVVGKLLLHL